MDTNQAIPGIVNRKVYCAGKIGGLGLHPHYANQLHYSFPLPNHKSGSLSLHRSRIGKDEGTIVLRVVPGKAEEGVLGLEIADLQGTVDLGLRAGTAQGEGQLGFGQRQILQLLCVVEIGQSVQCVLLGVRQEGQSLAFSGHCCENWDLK